MTSRVRPSTSSGRTRLLKLVLAYEGTRFAGWQRQKGHRSIQETVEQALHQILRERVSVAGAGRTDSGVHAEGQAAHVTIRSKMPLPTLHRALNAVLPEEVLVRSVRLVPRGFHARYSAKLKHYRYSIWNGPERPLFDRSFVTYVREPLDAAKMRRAARRLTGKRDFRAFYSKPRGSGAASSSRSHSGREVASTVRHLRSLTVTRAGSKILIDAKADGFLYHMVRRIAGALIEAGKGKPVDVTRTGFVAPTAPAKGLCLMEVRYV